jgi:hypothetical protein
MCVHAYKYMQEASSLTEFDLMMVPHLLTMQIRSWTLEESPAQIWVERRGVSMHGTSRGMGRTNGFKKRTLARVANATRNQISKQVQHNGAECRV